MRVFLWRSLGLSVIVIQVVLGLWLLVRTFQASLGRPIFID